MFRKFSVLFLLWTFFFVVSCSDSKLNRKKHAFLHRGNIAVDEKLYKDALRYYQESILLDSTFALAYFNKGIVLSRINDPQNAISAFSKAIKFDSTLMDAYFQRSECFTSTKQYAQAMRDLQVCLVHSPDSLLFNMSAGMVYFYQSRYDSALYYFEHTIALDSTQADGFINLGTALYFLGNYDRAVKELVNGMELNPDEPNSYNVMGLLLTEQEKFDSAEISFRKALEMKPQDPFFLNNYGYMMLMKGELEGAKKYIDQSIVMNPENPWAYRNKGLYYLKTKDNTNAIKLLSLCIEMEPFISNAKYYLAAAYLASGRKQEACEIWGEDASLNSQRASSKHCM